MKAASSRLFLIGFALSLLVPSAGAASASAAGAIAGVRVSAHGKHVIILCDGPVGRHATSVLSNPNRLVIDFDDTGLRGAERKLRVDKEPIKEIRLGHFQSKARIVVDFGESPVPSHRIHSEQNSMILVLGKPATQTGGATKPRTVRNSSNGQPAPERPVRAPAVSGKESTLAIRSATVEEGMVVLELADRNSPQRTARLVVDVDMNRLRVRHASVTAAANAVSLAEGQPQSPVKVADQQLTTGPGPRKAPTGIDSSDSQKKYQWWQPTVQPRGPDVKPARSDMPLRLERWSLQKRPMAREMHGLSGR